MFDQWWQTRAPAEQAALTARALERLQEENPTLLELTRRRPNSPMLQAALRPLLKELSGYQALVT